MSQATERIINVVNSSDSIPIERERYDVIVNQSRGDVKSVISDITDKEGPIVGARGITTTMSSDLQAAQSQYYNMSGMIDNMVNQISRRPTDTRDLYVISSMIGQFENTFEQLEQSKRALTGFIPQAPEQ
jgi:hypothetical protein